MGPPPTQKELSELEQNKSPSRKFLNTTAEFLRLDLKDADNTFNSECCLDTVRKGFAPREEFALKLLLKKVSSSSKNNDSPAPLDHIELHRQFWLLLLHLFHSIPVRSLAQILSERDFLEILDSCASAILRQEEAHNLKAETETAYKRRNAQPQKKRKLSPTSSIDGALSNPATTSADVAEVQMLILEIVRSLVHLSKRSTKVDYTASYNIRTVLSASAEQAASITGKLLRIALRQEVTSETSSAIATDITLIWQYRRSDSDIANVQTSDQAFTRHILRPSIELLAASNSNSSLDASAQDLVQNLERLIALHSVLPLRALFQAERASQWKSQSTTITWEDLKDLYEVVSSALVGVEYHRSGWCGFSANSALSFVSVYLDIAIRAVPRSTLRRAQMEQPWIDCLFSVTAHLVSPSLPRMITNRNGILEELQMMDVKPSWKSIDGVGGLLALVMQRGIFISLPVLVYFASAVLATTGQALAWTVIAGLVNQNLNILLPNSGVPNSKVLLDQVCQLISNGGIASEDGYTLVRDDLVRPLLDGFAQARDLKGFVGFWLNGLADSMQQRASGGLDFNSLHYCLIWEDETLFRHFEDVCRSYGTPNFSRELVDDLLRGLKQIGVRIGPTVDVVSRIAVVDALLSSCPEDILPNLDTIEEITAATVSALQRRSDYQYQRWRLWAFLRRCLLMQTQQGYIEKQLSRLSGLGILVSLPSAQDVSGRQGYARSAYLQEALECFHLHLVQDHTGHYVVSTELRQSEIKKLIDLFSIKTESRNSNNGIRHLKQMHNGRELAWACTSILLANPRVLHDAPPTTRLLVSTMIQSLDSTADPDMTTQRLLHTILAEECGSEMFHKSCAALSTLKDITGHLPAYARDILSSLPVKSFKKSLAENLAERIVTELQTENLTRKPAEALADFFLLETLTTASNVSIGKPQNWRRLTELANALLSQPGSVDNIRAMMCPLWNIFHQVWQRILQSENTSPTKTMIQDIRTWCMSRIDHLATSEYTAGDSVVLTRMVNGMCIDMLGSSFALTPEELKELNWRYSKMLVSQFQRLAGFDMINEQNVLLFLLVTEAMQSCEELRLLDTSKAIQITIDGAIERWKFSFPGSNLPSLLLIAIENVRYQLRHVAEADGQHLLTHDDMEVELRNFASGSTTGQLAGKVTKFVESVGPENFGRLLNLVEQSRLDSTSFVIIGAIVCQTSSEALAQSPNLAAHMSRLATLGFAMQAQTTTDACIALESCMLILDVLPETVNQWTMDTLLRSVATLASPNSLPGVSSENATAIFNRLCSVLGLALTRSRKRIGGRYHVLLPALQALLRCLFYAGSGPNAQLQTKQQILFARSFPFWLTSSKGPLPSSSADQFTCILTTICDPSTSSVRTSRHRGASLELTDETKKAKSLAGQYMQYLVMEYAKCVLNGRIKPEVKEKLMPGMYAVMDVMGREVMRGMNAAMDASSRAIFKTLYDDYQRYGKWNQS